MFKTHNKRFKQISQSSKEGKRKCYIKTNDENIGKFDSRSDEGIFLGYLPKKKGPHMLQSQTAQNCAKI